jgi:hypothetical protein
MPALLLALLAGSAPATAEAPALLSQGANLADFVPAGWAVEQLRAADLNRDGHEDALLLLRHEAAAPGPGPGLSPPRMLVVLLGDPAGFVLSARNTKLIPQVDLAGQEDPFADGELVAWTGGFDIKLALLSGVGSYLSAVLRYRFAYQGGCFRLIAYDRLETHRATLDTNDLRINYLIGTITRTIGSARTEANNVVYTRLLPSPPHRCLEHLDNAAEFVPP